jgi:steroid delta-isomerase-like uncharacterized protein
LSKTNNAVFDELLDPTINLHGAPPGLPAGMEGFKLLAGMFRTAFPDYKDTVEDLIAEGDKVVARWSFRGTHQGDFQGVPPTGKEAAITGISVFRLINGKITDDWTIFDLLGLMQQLGAIPAPGQGGG